MWALDQSRPRSHAPVAENLYEISLWFRPRFHEIHLPGIGRAQHAVECVKIVAFPRNVSLAHPFAPRDGIGGFSKIAASLGRYDETVQERG
jgi:hypothetical protein